MSASAISTVFPSNGDAPARLTFLRSAREKNLLSAAAVPDALTKIIAREEEVFAWLEKSEANHRLFASDPVAGLQAAIPDLDPALIDELRAHVNGVARAHKSAEPVMTRTSKSLFEDAVSTFTPTRDAMLLTATPTAMNGWDMIVATRQGLINNGLKKLYTSETIKTTVDVGGFIGKIDIDVKVGPPSVETLEGGGRLARVTLPLLEGKLKRVNDGYTINVKNAALKVTSNLVTLEASAQPKPGEGKNYDVFIDVKSDQAVYDVELPGTSDPLASAFLVAAMKAYLQSLAGKTYKIATINLGKNVPKAVEPLIPQVANFTFIKHPSKPEETTFAVLLLNDTKKPRGDYFFNASMLPDGVQAVGMISNEVFIREMVYPALKDAIAKKARGGTERNLVTQKDSAGGWHIRNIQDVDLVEDKDPWIENGTLDCRVDGDKLRLQLEVRARVTFLDILVKIRGFVGWQVQVTKEGNEQKIDLVQVEYREEKESEMEWWKWLIAALAGTVALIVTAIVNGLVNLNIPSLPKNVFKMPMESVRWPYYDQLSLDAVNLPYPVVIQGTPKVLQ